MAREVPAAVLPAAEAPMPASSMSTILTPPAPEPTPTPPPLDVVMSEVVTEAEEVEEEVVEAPAAAAPHGKPAMA